MSQSTEIQENIIELKELLVALKKHLVIIIITGIATGILGFAATKYLMTPIYEASSTMLVNTRVDQSVAVTNDQIISAKNLVDTYAIIIKSDTVLNPVIDKLVLEGSYKDLLRKVSVEAVNDTQVMRISVKDYDPQKAKQIVIEIVRIAPGIIIDTVEAGSVKTISAPFVTEEPVAPNHAKNTVVSAFLGLVIAIGIIMIYYILDNTFKSELDIQKQLGLPVLGIIPSIESCSSGRQERATK